MGKRKRDRRAEIARIPLLNRAGVMPGSTNADDSIARIKPGVFARHARGTVVCDEGHRDAVIVGCLGPQAIEQDPRAGDWIILDCIADCEGRSVQLFFDRDGVRDLINRLQEMLVESERRAASAA